MWEDGRVGAPERIEGWRGIEEGKGRVEGERSERAGGGRKGRGLRNNA